MIHTVAKSQQMFHFLKKAIKIGFYRSEMAFGEANKGHFPKALLSPYPMVFENHRKSLIQHCERLHFEPKNCVTRHL